MDKITTLVAQFGLLKTLGVIALIVLFSGVIIRILMGLLKMSSKLFGIILSNSLSGLILLNVLNKLGFGIAITGTNTILAGLFGVPGLIIAGLI